MQTNPDSAQDSSHNTVKLFVGFYTVYIQFYDSIIAYSYKIDPFMQYAQGQEYC